MFRILVLVMLMFLPRISSANVVNGHKWYEITGPEEFYADFRLSPGGRVAYYSQTANVLSIWTAMINSQNPSQTRWVLAAREGEGGLIGKLLGAFYRLECRDEECFFTTTYNGNAIVWKASSLNSVPLLSKILEAGQVTNLGVVRSLWVFMLDGSKLYIYADVGSLGAGVYELSSQGTLVARFAQSSTQIFEWNTGKMFVRDGIFVFVGKINYLGGDGKTYAANALFRVSIVNRQVAEVIGTNLPRINGILVVSCCDLTANSSSFLVRFTTHELPDRGDKNKSNIVFMDALGQTKLVAKADDYRFPELTVYGASLAERGGSAWGDFSIIRSDLLDPISRAERKTLFSWRQDGEMATVAKTEDSLYASPDLVDKFTYSSTTTDNRRVVATYNPHSLPPVRLGVGFRPTVTSVSSVNFRPGDQVVIKGNNLFLNGMTTRVRVGTVEIVASRILDDIMFTVPAEIPNGKHLLKVELADPTGTIILEVSEVTVGSPIRHMPPRSRVPLP